MTWNEVVLPKQDNEEISRSVAIGWIGLVGPNSKKGERL